MCILAFGSSLPITTRLGPMLNTLVLRLILPVCTSKARPSFFLVLMLLGAHGSNVLSVNPWAWNESRKKFTDSLPNIFGNCADPFCSLLFNLLNTCLSLAMLTSIIGVTRWECHFILCKVYLEDRRDLIRDHNA